jgi:hypothetical protein
MNAGCACAAAIANITHRTGNIRATWRHSRGLNLFRKPTPPPRTRSGYAAMTLQQYLAMPRCLAARHWRPAVGALLLMLTSCSGGQSGMSAGSTMTVPPPLMADFESIQTNIFTPICSGCHGGSHPAANLDLDAAHSYDDLVNVPSTEEPTLDRVKPGDPASSFLVIHMQSDGDGAPASDVPFVAQWITDGALH